MNAVVSVLTKVEDTIALPSNFVTYSHTMPVHLSLFYRKMKHSQFTKTYDSKLLRYSMVMQALSILLTEKIG